MLTRIVRMTFQPEKVADFLAIFRDSENKIRNTPGCRHLELWQDADVPNVYCTHSRWDSATDLDNYRRSALFGQVWPATKALFAAPPLAFSVYPAGPESTSSPLSTT
ncbi:putative quinol monooxygenase [Hymenobacter cellulosivorans]|uniref:Antibiotic biosynthesis monooxygenase n=1 Tax=Hymenobacter cellulosivorans TaxID=2932249 RepID=A0ABY4FFL9_9BACT|nr:antibiotic biosynthesis monooxygenase family protein [Hymenobacter cellulosivorans]UOQ55477.1 antibiotic biosynthesis monooxygenase [Hymenobacter cellulosivorans]